MSELDDLKEQVSALSRKVAEMGNRGPLAPDDEGITLFDASGVIVGRVAALEAGSNITLTKSGKYGVITGASGGSGGAPTTASYLVLGTDSTLTAERVLTEGANIKIDDAGAGSTLTLSTRIREVQFSLGELAGITI